MFEFSEQQTAFLKDLSRLRIMGGSAVGTGKTFVGYYEALRLSREIPNNYGVIFCDTPNVEQLRFQDMMQLRSGDFSLPILTDANEIFIHLPEGEKSTIAFLRNRVDERRWFGGREMLAQFYPLQSMNLGFVMFEAIETLTLGDVEDIFQRLRRKGDDNRRVNRRMWGTAADKPYWIDTIKFDNRTLQEVMQRTPGARELLYLGANRWWEDEE